MKIKWLYIGGALIILTLAFGKFLNKKPNTLPLPQQYVDDRTTFSQVKQLFNEAVDLTKPPDNSGKPFDMSKEQEAQIRSKLNEGINLSKNIDDGFLNYLNPDLANNFRNKYVRGYELFLEGLNSDTSNENSVGVTKQFEGNKLIDEYNKWWNLNKDTITDKAFTEE